MDADGAGDACDPCPMDNPDDSDSDGVCDSADVCPGGNDNVDANGNGVPDDCDARGSFELRLAGAPATAFFALQVEIRHDTSQVTVDSARLLPDSPSFGECNAADCTGAAAPEPTVVSCSGLAFTPNVVPADGLVVLAGFTSVPTDETACRTDCETRLGCTSAECITQCAPDEIPLPTQALRVRFSYTGAPLTEADFTIERCSVLELDLTDVPGAACSIDSFVLEP
jgi:hypothetical protein